MGRRSPRQGDQRGRKRAARFQAAAVHRLLSRDERPDGAGLRWRRVGILAAPPLGPWRTREPARPPLTGAAGCCATSPPLSTPPLRVRPRLLAVRLPGL